MRRNWVAGNKNIYGPRERLALINPVGVLNKLDYFRSIFFGEVITTEESVVLPSEAYYAKERRVGIHDLELKNIALQNKWLFKLLTTDWIWQQIIRNKYLGLKSISQVYKKKWGFSFLGKPHEGQIGFHPSWLLCN